MKNRFDVLNYSIPALPSEKELLDKEIYFKYFCDLEAVRLNLLRISGFKRILKFHIYHMLEQFGIDLHFKDRARKKNVEDCITDEILAEHSVIGKSRIRDVRVLTRQLKQSLGNTITKYPGKRSGEDGLNERLFRFMLEKTLDNEKLELNDLDCVIPQQLYSGINRSILKKRVNFYLDLNTVYLKILNNDVLGEFNKRFNELKPFGS